MTYVLLGLALAAALLLLRRGAARRRRSAAPLETAEVGVVTPARRRDPSGGNDSTFAG